jgi:hypothetical protein
MLGESAVIWGCGTVPGQLMKLTIAEHVQAENKAGRRRINAMR